MTDFKSIEIEDNIKGMMDINNKLLNALVLEYKHLMNNKSENDNFFYKRKLIIEEIKIVLDYKKDLKINLDRYTSNVLAQTALDRIDTIIGTKLFDYAIEDMNHAITQCEESCLIINFERHSVDVEKGAHEILVLKLDSEVAEPENMPTDRDDFLEYAYKITNSKGA